MDVAYINPFVSATGLLFETMLKLPHTVAKPTARRHVDGTGANDQLHALSVEMTLRGSVRGPVVLTFPDEVACAMAAALVGRPFTPVDDELRDALGELANMVVGGAKSTMPGGAGTEIGTPRIVPANEVQWAPGRIIIAVPFDIDAGRFVLETSLAAAA